MADIVIHDILKHIITYFSEEEDMDVTVDIPITNGNRYIVAVNLPDDFRHLIFVDLDDRNTYSDYLPP